MPGLTLINQGSSSISAGGTSGSVGPGYPASIVAGQMLIAYMVLRASSPYVPTPDGWTLLGSHTSGNVSLRVFGKIATGSESGSLSLEWTGGATSGTVIARILSFTGQASTWASGIQTQPANNTSALIFWNTNDFMPVSAGKGLLLIGGADDDTGISGEGYANAGGDPPGTVSMSQTVSASGNDAALYYGYTNGVTTGVGTLHDITATLDTGENWATLALLIDIDVSIPGALDVTLGNVTLSGGGSVQDPPRVGTLTKTLDNITSTGDGSVVTTEVFGVLSATLGALTLLSAGIPDTPVDANITLGSLTVGSTGIIGIAAVLTNTLEGVGISLDGYVVVGPVGLLTVTLGDVGVAAAVESQIAGALAVNLADVAVSFTGSFPVLGQASLTLQDATLVGASGVSIFGDLGITLGLLNVSSQAGAAATGTLSAILGHFGITSQILTKSGRRVINILS